MPTEEQEKNRELALTQINSGVLQDSPEFKLPETQQASDFGGFAESAATGFLDAQAQAVKDAEAQAKAAERVGGDLQSQILGITEGLGEEGARQRELEESTGFKADTEALRGIASELQALQLERANIPQILQEESVGRGRTVGGLEPIQAGELRKNSIKTLTAAAQGAFLQGNIEIAQTRIQQALDAEFEPQRLELQVLQQQYLFNRDSLERLDKKRADALNIALGERARILGIQEVSKKSIYDIGLTAQKFGADSATVQAIFNSRTPEEAVQNAGNSLQDPAAQQDLANAKLSNQLTKLKISREQEEIALLRKYGGLSPTEWAKLRKEELEEFEKAQEDADQAIVRGRDITTDITQVSAILNSSALDTIVGPTIFSRGTARQKGKFSTFVSGLGTAPTGFLAGGLVDEFAGADDVVSDIEQMTSQLFLDKLVGSKERGATFGQLSDREGDALRAAATSISQTAILDNNGKTVGYDMSEAKFREQMAIIQERLQFLYKKTTGDAFTPDEQAVFDAIDGAQVGFNPAF